MSPTTSAARISISYRVLSENDWPRAWKRSSTAARPNASRQAPRTDTGSCVDQIVRRGPGSPSWRAASAGRNAVSTHSRKSSRPDVLATSAMGPVNHRRLESSGARVETLHEAGQPGGRAAPERRDREAGRPSRNRAEESLGQRLELVAVRPLDDVRSLRPRTDDDTELSDPSVRQCLSRQHRVVQGAQPAPGDDEHPTVGKRGREVRQGLTGVGQLDEQPSRTFDDDEVVAYGQCSDAT